MKQPLVSIMIPCYNQAHSIARAIQSALDQNYENIEVVVSDDNSADSTPSVVEAFLKNPKVKYIRSSTQLGRVKNYRQLVYNLSHGELAINLDGDDYFVSKTFIQNAVKVFEAASQEKSEVAFVFGRQQFEDLKTCRIWSNPSQLQERSYSSKELILILPNLREVMPHIATLYRRDLAMRANIFADDIVYADAQALIKLVAMGRCSYIDEIVGTWVRNGSNESTNADFEKRCKNFRMIDEPAKFFFEQRVLTELEIEDWKKKMAIKLGRESACAFLDSNDRENYLKFMAFLRTKYGDLVCSKISKDWRIQLRLRIPSFYRWSEFFKSAIHTSDIRKKS